jgi:hypothetical protein
VKGKVLGLDQPIPAASALVLKNAEVNIGKSLLQCFDAESDDEGGDANVGPILALVDKTDHHMPPLSWKEKKQWGPIQATRMSRRI